MAYSDWQIQRCSPRLQALLRQRDSIMSVSRSSLTLESVLNKIIYLAKEEKLGYIYVRSMYDMVYFQNSFNEPRKAVQYAEIFLREGPSIFEETLPSENNPTFCRHTYSGFFELIGDIYTKFYQISSEKMEQFFNLYREVVRSNGKELLFYECRLEWELMCWNKGAVKKACRHYETLPIGNLCYVCRTRVVCKSRVLLGDLNGALNYVTNIISGNIPAEAWEGYELCEDTTAYAQYMLLFENCLECGKIDLLDRVLPLTYKVILADEENKEIDYSAALVYALYGNFERWKDRVKDARTYIDELKLYKPYTNMHQSLSWMTYFKRLHRSGVEWIDFPTKNPVPLELNSAGQYSVAEISNYFEQVADEIGWKFEKNRTNFAYAKRKGCFKALEEILFIPLSAYTGVRQFSPVSKSTCFGKSSRGDVQCHPHQTIMLPPWLAYPEIERYSIGWRMGYGEDYIDRFSTWLETISAEEQAEYQTLFPAPITWKGWWQDADTCETLGYSGFSIPLWQPEGSPKYTVSQLQQEVAASKRQDMCLFWGHQPNGNGSITKSCFSQWWMTEFWSVAHHYCCMEQFMMAQKAELFGNEDIRQQILESKDPKQIKALGRKVQRFDQTLWDKAKYSIVLNGNWCKFSQNRDLRDFLLATGDSILAEASPYDAIWGIRLSEDSQDAQNPLKWRGQNLLGFALMEVRDELRRVTQNESLCEWSTLK